MTTKLYLAYNDTQTLMEGYYENCVGVFDSEQKAWECLEKTYNYNNSMKKKNQRVYHFDGELSYYWYVKEVILNKGLNEE